MSKKKLLLSIEDLKALGIIKKKKKKRKVKRNKRAADYNNIYGIKSDSLHLKTGFGGQINTNNDLQNELIRNQMKTIEDDQKLKNQTQQMVIEDRRFNRNEYYPRIDELNRRHDQLVNQSSKIVRDIYNKINNDNIDVARTGGSDFFNTEGKPVPENDNINENIAEYVSQKEFEPQPLSVKQKRQESLIKARQVRAQKVLIRKEAKAKTEETNNIQKINDLEGKNIASYNLLKGFQSLPFPEKTKMSKVKTQKSKLPKESKAKAEGINSTQEINDLENQIREIEAINTNFL